MIRFSFALGFAVSFASTGFAEDTLTAVPAPAERPYPYAILGLQPGDPLDDVLAVYTERSDAAPTSESEVLRIQSPDGAVFEFTYQLYSRIDAHGKQLNVQAETLVPLQVQCRSHDGTLIGGLLGNTGDTWLHIWQLWVAEEWRSQSFGSQILAAAEDEAIRRKCRHAHLETMSFQGVNFYLDRGYEEYGVLQNYVGAHAQHFLRKTLIR